MKLESRPRLRKDKSAEVLRVTDQRPESELFDPRFDLPQGETQRLLALAARGEQPSNPRQRRKLDALVWLAWVDPKYSETLKRLPHYTDLDPVDTQEWEGRRNLSEALVEVDVLLQINPELREFFSGLLQSDVIFTREQAAVDDVDRVPDSDVMRLGRVLRMIRLWPEKRTELLNRYYPEDDRQFLLEKNDRQRDTWSRLVHAAELVLLLPELRPVVLRKIQPELNKWKLIVAQAQQTDTHVTGFEVLQSELSSLAILFADNAQIDDRGMVKLELPPLPVGKAAPLPDRPLA